TMTSHLPILPTELLGPEVVGKANLHWAEYFLIDRCHDGLNCPLPKPQDGRCVNFLSFAISNGLFYYVQLKLQKGGKGSHQKAGLPLLSFACGPEPYWWLLPDILQSRTVQALLDVGADPNQTFRNKTPW